MYLSKVPIYIYHLHTHVHFKSTKCWFFYIETIYGISVQTDIGHFEIYYILLSKETELQFCTLLMCILQWLVTVKSTREVNNL